MMSPHRHSVLLGKLLRLPAQRSLAIFSLTLPWNRMDWVPVSQVILPATVGHGSFLVPEGSAQLSTPMSQAQGLFSFLLL